MCIKSSPLLPSPLLRQSIGVFAPVLAHMANLSFRECCFPSAFKTARVLPLLKKPGLDTPVLSNFRPISNWVTVSKILERLALLMLRRHLHGSANFSRLQPAYRSGHSTETALLHVLDSVYTAADSRRSTVPSVLVGLDIIRCFLHHHTRHTHQQTRNSVRRPRLCMFLAPFVSVQSPAVR